VPPLEVQRLAEHGSLYLTRPTLRTYTATRDELLSRAGAVLELVRQGKLEVRIEAELPLAQAAKAHELLASRATKGKIILVP
jgi:NADPH2:quinone reductase